MKIKWSGEKSSNWNNKMQFHVHLPPYAIKYTRKLFIAVMHFLNPKLTLQLIYAKTSQFDSCKFKETLGLIY